MGDCMRSPSRKRSAETAEMEASSTSFSLSKRRKTAGSREFNELELTSPDNELDKPRFLSNLQDKPITVATSSNAGGILLACDICSSLCSDESSASRCSSNESCDIVKDTLRFVDLKAKSFETEIPSCININKFSKETTSLRELSVDSEEMKSPEKNTPPSAAKPQKMPSRAEIDELFSAAEKHEQKRFTEKYNYDIVNDVPLDGRYQWIRLKP